ncbi:MAG: hypothetical protein BroJett017_28640 [Ignavibacteriota bacterium]|nr:MAG: hypothetical protein BroJett017_28640 [Ignavibacteriota bacterium]
MKKKIFSLCLSLFVFLSIPTFAQGPGEPYNPETANDAKNIHSTGHRLLWKNPDSTIFNIIYFSDDSILVAQMNNSVVLYNGSPNVTYDTIYLDSVEPLSWNTKYYWKVVEYYQSNLIEGPVWNFRTMPNPICEYEEFQDDFESGVSNWTVTNDGGNCVWEVFFPPYPNAYQMPWTSSGGLISADSDECGNGTSVITTITLNESFGGGYDYKSLEFDNDWNVLDSADEAYVEVSTNGGQTWEIIWSRIGEDLRMTHETVYITQGGDILLRFRVIQPGWDWWWAIDNVKLIQDCPLTQYYPPHNLKLNTIAQQSARVDLSWERLGPFYQPYFYIFRKLGLPTDPTNYSFVGMVPFTMTTFSDTAVIINNIYTYQINNGPFPNGFSNEATAYVQNIVPVELQSFTAEIIGSDVNLLWSTATETNNSGFDVEKKALSFGEGLGEAWKTIGFVHGFGTTTEVHHYLFVDERLQAGNYQYRLKQIDFDGTFEYSNIIEVTIDAPIEFSLEQNFPNPFNPTTKIKYTIPASLNPSKGGTLVQLQVFDILGNAVATLVNEQKQPGTYEVEFNTASHSGEVRNLPAGRQGLPSGIYFYKLQAGTFVQTKKMILIK